MSYPILYSFRRCPYAIRARMALLAVEQQVELREILLKDKPASMLAASAKGTVPVLVNGERILDESIEIMSWALCQPSNDKYRIASLNNPLVAANDNEFKHWLDRYKYFDRYPEHPQNYYWQKAQEFLSVLEESLSGDRAFIDGSEPHAVDMAVFPFIRQFAHVDIGAFRALSYPKLQAWLEYWLASDLFKAVMTKYEIWQEGQNGVPFGNTLAPSLQEPHG